MSVGQPPSICLEPGCGDLAVDYQGEPSSCSNCGDPYCGEHLTHAPSYGCYGEQATVPPTTWLCRACRP